MADQEISQSSGKTILHDTDLLPMVNIEATLDGGNLLLECFV